MTELKKMSNEFIKSSKVNDNVIIPQNQPMNPLKAQNEDS